MTDSNTPPLRSQSGPGCPLLEKLPAEIRLEIFGLVLRMENSVVNRQFRNWHVTYKWPPPRTYKPLIPNHSPTVNTGLFTVCRQISLEAQNTFYSVNTVRVKDEQESWRARTLTKHLEFDVTCWMMLWPGKNARVAVDAFSCLPKLKTVSVATHHRGSGKSARLISNCVRNGRIGDQLSDDRFVDLGVIEIAMPSPLDGKIFIKDFVLVAALADAKELLRTSSLQTLLDNSTGNVGSLEQRQRLVTGSQPCRPERPRPKILLRLALWLAAFDLWRGIDLDRCSIELKETLCGKMLPVKLLNDNGFGENVHRDVLDFMARAPQPVQLVHLNAQVNGEGVIRAGSLVDRYRSGIFD